MSTRLLAHAPRSAPPRHSRRHRGGTFARLTASQLRHDHQTADLSIAYQVFEGEAEALAWLKQLR